MFAQSDKFPTTHLFLLFTSHLIFIISHLFMCLTRTDDKNIDSWFSTLPQVRKKKQKKKNKGLPNPAR